MSKVIRFSMIVLVVLLTSGCASGVPFSKMQPELTASDPAMGRVFFYRTTTLGAAVKPKIHLNDEVIGVSQAKGFIFVDRPPGDYVVQTSTEVDRRLSFVLEQGQTRYVRFNVAMGFFVGHVNGELVDNDIGRAEIEKCKYTGELIDGG